MKIKTRCLAIAYVFSMMIFTGCAGGQPAASDALTVSLQSGALPLSETRTTQGAGTFERTKPADGAAGQSANGAESGSLSDGTKSTFTLPDNETPVSLPVTAQTPTTTEQTPPTPTLEKTSTPSDKQNEEGVGVMYEGRGERASILIAIDAGHQYRAINEKEKTPHPQMS